MSTTVNINCTSDRQFYGQMNVEYCAPGAVCMSLEQGSPTSFAKNMMFTFPLAAYAKKVIERAELSIVIGTKRAPNGASIDTTGYAYPAGSLVTRAYADSRAAESFAGAAELDGGMVAGSITTPYSGGAGNQTIKVDVTDLVKNNIYNGVFNALVYNMISGSGTWGVVYSKESSNVPVLSLTYSEYMPKTETVYPKDVYTKQGEDIEFIWGFSSQSDAVLASSRIEYSKNGINFALLAEVAGAVSSFRYDGGALGKGKTYWRVTVRDTNGTTAVSGMTGFYIIGRPDTPVITGATNDARPKIRWNAAEQSAYEIEVYQNGILRERERKSVCTAEYQCREFYPNGNIAVDLKVMNSFELWSETASKVLAVAAPACAKPDITLQVSGMDVIVTTKTTGICYLYRTIGKTTELVTAFEGQAIDRTIPSGTVADYFVRKYGGGYADSDRRTARVEIEGFVLDCGGRRVIAKYSDDIAMEFAEITDTEAVTVLYAGREYPCLEVGEHKARTVMRTAVLEKEAYATLREIKNCSEPVMYRDRNGNAMWCIMEKGLRADEMSVGMGYKVTVELTMIDGGGKE
ncbi:MAG: hypothetical protein K2P87_01675 [Lachnospiraceae bacterium]|nr:hypothetical protein [Lachnospiraceae bacterium]